MITCDFVFAINTKDLHPKYDSLNTLYTKKQKSLIKSFQNITGNTKLYLITRGSDLYAKNKYLNYFQCENLQQPRMWPLKINSTINGAEVSGQKWRSDSSS